MKIAVLGTRGFPYVQGGIEMHCQELYPRLARMGCKVTVFTRKPYMGNNGRAYENMEFIPIRCPRIKDFETIVHTFKGIIASKKNKPDILHIHGVGPSLLTPLARMLGIRVVVTNHGPDYKRKKWGPVGKSALKLGEVIGSYCADQVICISEDIAERVENIHKRDIHIIPNGIGAPLVRDSEETLKKFSLKKGKYILSVGRLVPEKGFDVLIKAFNHLSKKDWKLVIVGKADYKDLYGYRLRRKAKRNKNIVLTGFLSGQDLQEIYSHAGLFVLPSYYEGLPLVLLEALSYGLFSLASDIPANRQFYLPEENYFRPGDVKELTRRLDEYTGHLPKRMDWLERLKKEHDWDDIAQRTLEVYKKAVKH